MILITGAGGKTGRFLLKALLSRNREVRALVRNYEQADELRRIGAADAVTGDMTQYDSLCRAMNGVSAVYHICPNMHPKEIEIGRFALEAAKAERVSHFVYHSVLHPQAEKMPHHWNKMRVEEMLTESGLDFTILQPAPYMQNILANRDLIINKGIFRVPYALKSRISLVDLEDIGEAAAVVLTNSAHKGAIYELAGPEVLSQSEVAAAIAAVLGREVTAQETALIEWENDARASGLDRYQVETLAKMFSYYSNYGLAGCSNVLQWLIGRAPQSLASFIKREMAEA